MFTIRPATVDDVPTILALIKELAAYERLEHEVHHYITTSPLFLHLNS
jgi:N-acetylglutamate synthase-like GNAT family acetyltransferase